MKDEEQLKESVSNTGAAVSGMGCRRPPSHSQSRTRGTGANRSEVDEEGLRKKQNSPGSTQSQVSRRIERVRAQLSVPFLEKSKDQGPTQWQCPEAWFSTTFWFCLQQYERYRGRVGRL